ncbi:MAG TPA: class I SAM-dependent methyltransferase [Gemmatimonadaceae bacterium]|nr:class I SAM-dependent methyltransferase [Gemmatimonadaceae bacterium]
MKIPAPCPLCGAPLTDRYYTTAKPENYFRCPDCTLIHLDPSGRLSLPEERARYDLHRNDSGDEGYVQFLRRLADPMIESIRPGARGLDFGCGPAPVLSDLLTSAGFPCAAYDPLFCPDVSLLSRRYDFVTCSEVVEHVHEPALLFPLLQRLLMPGGVLGVMTRFYGDDSGFATWWYRRDPTHVCFYAEPTMRWIADHYGWSVSFPRSDVALFRSPG